MGVGRAWWHPEEIPKLSRSKLSAGYIYLLRTLTTDPKNLGCRVGVVASWRNTLDKSKQKHNAPGKIYLLPTLTNPKNLGCREGMVSPWRNTLAKSKQKHNAPYHNKDNSEKNGCRGGMVAPWRNTLAKSKQKHNAPSHNDNSKKMGVGVAWWHPEEMPWLSRSRSIMPLPTRTIQKKWGVWVAWWHNEEIPWLNRSRSIMLPSHNNDNSKKIGFRGGMVAPWRNTSGKSKQKHNCPIPQ